MPNHVHGILVVNKTENDLNETNAMKGSVVETQNFASLPKNHFGPQSRNLASIIRGFKVGVTKNARLIDAGFAWQSRFYDHIIRNEQSYQTISEYIRNNPDNWEDDKFYTT